MDFDKYKLKILQNSEIGANGRCKIWTGLTKQGIPNNYGVINVTFLNGKKTVMHAHKLAKCISIQQLITEKGIDVSHICHNKNCVLEEHLSIEPHYINNNRQTCKESGKCMGHDEYPMCLLDLIMH